LEKNASLKVLSLSANQIGHAGAAALAKASRPSSSRGASAQAPQAPTGDQRPPMVVLNCEDIRNQAGRSPAFQELGFWEGVWRVMAHYQHLGYMVQGVCSQATVCRHPPPSRVADHITKCPVVDTYGEFNGRGSDRATSDRVFVLRLAQTYHCAFVDNSNYRDSFWEGQASWSWLRCDGGADLKIEYIFDKFGQFVPSRDIPAVKS